MRTEMFIHCLLIRRLVSYKVRFCFVVLSVTICTVGYVCSFLRDQIFADFVSFKFLSMIIYEVLYILSYLRYNMCSSWFLDIRISTCSTFDPYSFFKPDARLVSRN